MWRIINKDVLIGLREVESESVQCCVTSPPYWGLRDYGHNGQIGLEKTPEEYVAKMVEIFREVRRVSRNDGTLWLVLGDTYHGGGGGNYGSGLSVASEHGQHLTNVRNRLDLPNLKPKDLVGIPWRVAFALQADGWWLRQDIIWSKPNPMPESVTDRCTKSHEYIFLLTKSAKYYYDAEAIKEEANYDGRKDTVMKGSAKYENGYVPNQSPQTMASRGHERWQRGANGEYLRNHRSVWTINTEPYPGSHFAVFPTEIPRLCISAGSKKGDTILDPFAGSGTTLEVAERLERNSIGIELSEKYVKSLIVPRMRNIHPLFNQEDHADR